MSNIDQIRQQVRDAIAKGGDADLVLFNQWLHCPNPTCDLCRVIAEELHLDQMPPRRHIA